MMSAVSVHPWQRQHPVESTTERGTISIQPFQKKYNPNQPRDPAGSSTGGQWTASGGPSSPSSSASSSTSSSLTETAKKADEVLQKVESWYQTNYPDDWQKRMEQEIGILESAREWSGGNYLDSTNRIVQKIQEGKVVLTDTSPYEYMVRRGQAAALLKEASTEKLLPTQRSIERVITADDPLNAAIPSQIYDLPLVPFTSAELSKGERAGFFFLRSGYSTDAQKLIRFKDPKIGFNLGAAIDMNPREREVLVTGKVRVESVGEETVRTGDGYKQEMTVVTLVRA